MKNTLKEVIADMQKEDYEVLGRDIIDRVYGRGAIGEILSFAILPLIALSVARLSNNEKINIRWVGIGALAFATLILSHNITGFMFIPFIILFWILRILFSVKEKLKSTILLISTIFLGLLTSIYFWLPAQ